VFEAKGVANFGTQGRSACWQS